MASLTLAGQQITNNDMLIKGIIESIVTVNQFYQMLPFKGIHGNALAYNRELSGVDQMDLVDVLDTGASSINKDAQRFSRHSTELTTLIGDAQVNGLIQAVGSDFNDATAIQVAAKAKGIGRRYMNLLINGTEGGTRSLPAITTSTSWTRNSTSGVWVPSTGSPTPEEFVATIADAAARTGQSTTIVNGVTFLLSDVTSWFPTVAATANNSIFTNASAAIALGTGAFGGPFGTGTSQITILTAGIALYNAAIRESLGNVGFEGINSIVPAGQTLAARSVATGDGVLNYLDLLIDRVHDKDGMVDYMMMNSKGVRKYTAALRATGAAGYDDVMEVKMSSGGVMKVQSYRGVPIFRNDFIQSSDLASVTGGDGGAHDIAAFGDQVFVGTFDDGTFTHGITGLTASKSAGMQVQKLGARENYDADITRVKWYCGLANFSELGLVKGLI